MISLIFFVYWFILLVFIVWWTFHCFKVNK